MIHTKIQHYSNIHDIIKSWEISQCVREKKPTHNRRKYILYVFYTLLNLQSTLWNQSSKASQHVATSVNCHSKNLDNSRNAKKSKDYHTIHKFIRKEFGQKCIKSSQNRDPEHIDRKVSCKSSVAERSQSLGPLLWGEASFHPRPYTVRY